MRAVLDTNVVVSGLIWGGKPMALLRAAADGSLVLATSMVLLKELREVLTRGHLAARLERADGSVERAVALYGQLAVVVATGSVPRVVPGDADDDHVVAAGAAAGARLIVSGDSHLLALRVHGGMRIVTPAEAVALLAV